MGTVIKIIYGEDENPNNKSMIAQLLLGFAKNIVLKLHMEEDILAKIGAAGFFWR
jgi:hypothetical protein